MLFGRGGQRDREGETRDPRAAHQLHEDGRHKESLGDDQPAGETRGATGGEERGDSWNSLEIVHGKFAFVFGLVEPLRRELHRDFKNETIPWRPS